MSAPKRIPFDGNLDLNFHPEVAPIFKAMISRNNDSSWTWSGMAYLLCEEYGQTDIEEFIYVLNEGLKRRYENADS